MISDESLTREFRLSSWGIRKPFPKSPHLLVSTKYESHLKGTIWKNNAYMKCAFMRKWMYLWNAFAFFNNTILHGLFCSSVKMINSLHPSHCMVWYISVQRAYKIYLAISHKKHSYFNNILKEKNLFFNKFWHVFPPDFYFPFKIILGLIFFSLRWLFTQFLPNINMFQRWILKRTSTWAWNSKFLLWSW